ncbi:unnamed protein product [Coregonus sp. 'balchen']|nr:unnamed protein product [Coregonus sp. 'balchen']
MRSEKKTKHHKKKLEQLCDKARPTATLGAGEGTSVFKPYPGGKRKRSPLSKRDPLPPSRVKRWDRRSWRRQLDSSASDSPPSDASVMLSPPYTHTPFLSPTDTSAPPHPTPLSSTSPNTLILSPSFSFSMSSSAPSTPSCPPAAEGTVTIANPKVLVTIPKARCQVAICHTPCPDMFNIKEDTAKIDDSEMRMSSEMKKTSTPKKMTEKCSSAIATTSVSSHASPTLKESKIPQADPPWDPIPGSKLTLTSIFSYTYHLPQTKRSPRKSPKSPCNSSPQSTTEHQKHKSSQNKKSPKTKTSDSPKLTPAPSLSEKQTDKTECHFKKPLTPQSVVSRKAGSVVSQHALSTKNTKSPSAGGSRPTDKIAKLSSGLSRAPTDTQRLFKTPSPNTSSHKIPSPKRPQSRGLHGSTQDQRIRDPIQDQSLSMRPTTSTSSTTNNPEGRPAASASILGMSSEQKMRQGFQTPDTPRPNSYPPKSKPTGISPNYRGTGTPFRGSEGNLTTSPTSRGLATSHDCPSQNKASYSATLPRERERERERERRERERERRERERCPPSPRHPHPAWGPVPHPSREGHPKEDFRKKDKTTRGQEDFRTKVKIPCAPTQKPSTSHKGWPNVPSPCQNPPPARNGPQSRSKKTKGTHLPAAQINCKLICILYK